MTAKKLMTCYQAAAADAGENGPTHSSSETATDDAGRSLQGSLRAKSNCEIMNQPTNGNSRRVNLFRNGKGDNFNGLYRFSNKAEDALCIAFI